MNAGFRDLLDKFIALGGIADNVCQRVGEHGRGIFPINSSCMAKIMTPKNLLVLADNLYLDGDHVVIKDGSGYTSEEIAFLELYWNDYSWGNSGNNDSASFLKFITSLEEPIKKQLLTSGFVDASFLSYREDKDCLLKRFVSERVVTFENQSVLAPVWEFVNHSSFAAPLRITPYGVETPPMESRSEEILFKYSQKNSPIGMWMKYGFACDCVFAYSIPFNIDIGDQALAIRCAGRLGLGPKEKSSFSIDGDILSIKSLPVGCLSVGLPKENFKSILSSVGLSADVSNRLFPKIREVNLKARRDLIDSLRESGSGAKEQLYKALMYEIELIESSLIG